MDVSKSIACVATAIGIAGGAVGHESPASMPADEAWMLFDPAVSWQGTWHDPEFSSGAALIYEIDEDRDGKADRLLILEDSETLG